MMMFHGYAGSRGTRADAVLARARLRHLLDDQPRLSRVVRIAGSEDADPAGCANGYVRLIDNRYDPRDAQEFAGLLADENLIDPQRIGAVGGSYGGGMSMALGALKNRKMLLDYRLVPWTSPGGKPMKIAATAFYLAKLLLGLINPTEGEIQFQGQKRDISSNKKRQEYWKNMQAIFQDPFSAYNTFHKIDSVLLDCIRMRGGRHLPNAKKVELMTEACSFVNLKFAELTNKYPFELSGGQMQRLMIARIFLLKPKILLADEPTSMIDACSRATILDMLMQLRDDIGMTIVFITHDIGLAYYVSDSVWIMEHGKFVEHGSPMR